MTANLSADDVVAFVRQSKTGRFGLGHAEYNAVRDHFLESWGPSQIEDAINSAMDCGLLYEPILGILKAVPR